MEENLKWLWYAFSAAWIVVLLYVVSLDQREKKLRQELETLKSMLQDRNKT